VRVGVLTVSDGCFRGIRDDTSGEAIVSWCAEAGYEVAARKVVPDDVTEIVPVLLEWADAMGLDVVLTTGGTGLTPRDVTPEATRVVLEREAPGIAEELRRRGVASTPFSILSRGLAGVRGTTLLVNLPGSKGGVRDGLALLDTVLDHAVALAHGSEVSHGAGGDTP